MLILRVRPLITSHQWPGINILEGILNQCNESPFFSNDPRQKSQWHFLAVLNVSRAVTGH